MDHLTYMKKYCHLYHDIFFTSVILEVFQLYKNLFAMIFQNSPCLVNPEHLIPSDIDEQIAKGNSAVHIAVGFASDSIVRVLKDSNLPQILRVMQKRFILELEDFFYLTDVRTTSGNIKCAEKLNVLLQKTSHTNLLKFVTILNDMGSRECKLGNFIQCLLKQCDERSVKEGEVQEERGKLSLIENNFQSKTRIVIILHLSSVVFIIHHFIVTTT